MLASFLRHSTPLRLGPFVLRHFYSCPLPSPCSSLFALCSLLAALCSLLPAPYSLLLALCSCPSDADCMKPLLFAALISFVALPLVFSQTPSHADNKTAEQEDRAA